MGSASSITYQPPPQLPSVEAARVALTAQLYKSDRSSVLPARSDTDQASTFTHLVGPVLASSDQACRGYVSEACLVSAMESCGLCVDTTRLQDMLWALALAERDVVTSASSRCQTTGTIALEAAAEAVPLRRTRMGIDGGNELLLFHYPTLLSCLDRADPQDGRIASTENPSPFVISLPNNTSSVNGPVTARAMGEARAIVAACLRDDDPPVAATGKDGQSCGGGMGDPGRYSSHQAGRSGSTESGDRPAVLAKSRDGVSEENRTGTGHDSHADVDIWLAAKRGDVCALQAARTCDPSLDFAQVDAFGNTALYYTCLCGYVEACRFVLECVGGPERVQPDEMLRNVTNALNPAIRCVLQGKEVPAVSGADAEHVHGGFMPANVGRGQSGGGDGTILLAGFDIFAEDTEQAEREDDDDGVRVSGSEDRGDCVNATGAALGDPTADVAGCTGPPEAAA